MDDLDRLIAESMRSAADHGPSDAGLLSSVHQRSGRYRRRRVATFSAAAAVLAAGLPFAVAAAVRTDAPQPAPAPAATAAPATPPPSRPPSPSRPASSSPSPTPTGRPPTPSTPQTPDTQSAPVTLTSGWAAPTFPYRLPNEDHRREPVASMNAGALIGFFETTDYDEADVTVTVSRGRPTVAGPSTSADVRVRGHDGTLHTVDVRPAKRLTLIWRESATRWIRLATDDTYRPDEVVALAESLTPASIAVLPPFQLSLSPAGLATRTVSRSQMLFGTPDAQLAVVLRDRRPLTGGNEKVNGLDAALTRTDGVTTLAVDVPTWQATLEITVSGRLTMSDADLLRFAAGVRILPRSDPE